MAPLAELPCKWLVIPTKSKAPADLKNILLKNNFQIALN